MATNTLFYKDPTVLSKESHPDLTFQAAGDLSFANEMNSVPIAGAEFPQALHDHPVFFVKSSKASGFTPICLLSLTNGTHSVGDNWDGKYVPAFIRRYPFGVTEDGTIVFDKTAAHFEGDGEKLFDENKEPSEKLKEIINFLGSVDAGYQETEEFCAALAAKEMIVPLNQSIRVGEKNINLSELYKIDEAKLHDLDAKELHEWFSKKYIAWAYSHLASVAKLGDVVKRLEQDQKAAMDKAPEETAADDKVEQTSSSAES